MAISFYNAGDNAIYDSGQHFVPQEKYRLGYTPPATPEPVPVPGGGITNTNAFNNSGGGGNFNFGSGNAFGYGSPVNEVNVRTFNPQSNDPTGSVANAQTMYNKASNAGPMVETFSGMRPSNQVMDYYNEQIMNNKEQYGAQGQYKSPYDDTVDLGYKGRDSSTSLRRNKFGNIIDTVTNFIPGVGMAKKGIKFLGGLLPQGNDNGPGGGTYGIGGLSDAQKEQYNTLAGQGMLFNGQNGFKTLTGKNFNAKNYAQGQIDIYNKKGYDEYTVDEDDVYDASGKKLTGFLKKQYLEASSMYKTTEKQKKEAEEQKKQEEATKTAVTMQTNNFVPPSGTPGGGTAYDYSGRDNQYGTHDSTISNKQAQTNQESYRGGNGGNQNQGGDTESQTNSQAGKGGFADYARGGRAGYFFGGRVNYRAGGRVSFKNGGLASIL